MRRDGIIRKWVPAYEIKALAPDSARRLVKLCGMFGSNHGGERAAAALKADTLIKQSGETWESVLMPQLPAPTNDWRGLVRPCLMHPRFGLLDPREQNFLGSLAQWRGEPSEKQLAWLRSIVARLEVT